MAIDLAYRTATRPLAPTPAPAPTAPRAVYLALLPHPAFSPAPDPSDPIATANQQKNEAVYRQLLAHAVLAVLLPAEALRETCLRTLVADVLGDMILGNAVGGRACAPWMVWEGIARAAEGHAEVEKAHRSHRRVRSRRDRHEAGDGGPDARRLREPLPMTSRLVGLGWLVLRHVLLALAALRFVIEGLVAAAGSPSHDASPPGLAGATKPILAYSIFGLVSQLLELPGRMPWTVGALELGQHHLVSGALRVGARGGRLDK